MSFSIYLRLIPGWSWWCLGPLCSSHCLFTNHSKSAQTGLITHCLSNRGDFCDSKASVPNGCLICSIVIHVMMLLYTMSLCYWFLLSLPCFCPFYRSRPNLKLPPSIMSSCYVSLEGTLSGLGRNRIDQFAWICRKGMSFWATEYVVAKTTLLPEHTISSMYIYV